MGKKNNSKTQFSEKTEEMLSLFKKMYKDFRANNIGDEFKDYAQDCIDFVDNDYAIKSLQIFIDGNKENKEREHYDFTLSRANKREKATRKYLTVAESFSKLYSSKDAAVLAFVRANCLIMCGGYNYVDKEHYLTAATAVWILDQLTLQGNLKDIYPIIFRFIEIDNREADYAFWPEINHPVYEKVLIGALIRLILSRNEDIRRKSDKPACLLYDERDFNIKSEYRELFEQVISLIDKRAIKNAIKEYERKVWDFYKLAFTVDSLLLKESDRLSGEIEKLRNSIVNIGDNNSYDGLVIYPFAKTENMRSKKSSSISSDAFKNIHNNDVFIKIREAEKRHTEFEWKTGSDLTDICNMNSRENFIKIFPDIIPENISEEIMHFRVEDPFESSFALLYLLDTGSDIPWLYYGSIAIAYTIYDQLPFSIEKESLDSATRKNDYDYFLYIHKFAGSRFEGEKDAFDDIVHREYATNIGQILYKSTDTLFPRVIHSESVTESDTEIEAEYYKKLLSIFMAEIKHRKDEFNNYLIERILDSSDEEDESDETEFDKESSLKTNSANTQIIKGLRRELWDMTNLYKSLEEKLKQREVLISQLTKELSDLREIVFNKENEIEFADEEKKEYQYPCKTSKKIVSFGGHNKWLSSMHDNFPDVRFVAPDTIPNEDMIRNADEVWIQTNCISHSYFYKVISIVRLYNINVRYFKYEGVKRCSEQMVESFESDK